MGGYVVMLYVGCFFDEVENLILIDCGGLYFWFGNCFVEVLVIYVIKMVSIKLVNFCVYESVEKVVVRWEEIEDNNLYYFLFKESVLLIIKRGIKVINEGVIFFYDLVVRGFFCLFIFFEVFIKLILYRIKLFMLVLEGIISKIEIEVRERFILLC